MGLIGIEEKEIDGQVVRVYRSDEPFSLEALRRLTHDLTPWWCEPYVLPVAIGSLIAVISLIGLLWVI